MWLNLQDAGGRFIGWLEEILGILRALVFVPCETSHGLWIRWRI